MWNFIKRFFRFFSFYVNSFERRVDRFFNRIKSSDNISNVRGGLLSLMQENLIITNVWLERKFKGYKYLKKSYRRKMYQDSEIIVKKFKSFCKQNKINKNELKKRLDRKALLYPNGDEDKIEYLAQIMEFLKPGKYYHYLKTSSFGRLLRNPDEEKLEGDCNQIVTLYIYLFSLKFSIDDLRIKLLPEHVCLHFRGIDIEATNGRFYKYQDDQQILPVTEIISTNLLDLTDFREEVQKISPRDFVRSSELAYAISSLRSLVKHNLNVAYRNLAIASLKSNSFDTAIFYANKLNDSKLLASVYHKASVYYMDNNSFRRAKYYANRSHNNELIRVVRHNEGIYYYKRDNISRALKIFRNLNDQKMIKACYQKEYNKLVRTVSGVKTLEDVRKHRNTYRKMLDLAVKMGNTSLQRSIRKTLNKL